MKVICLLLAVLACASALSTVDHDWETFKVKFDKHYSKEEEIRHHAVFRETKKMIEEHNKLFEEGKVTFKMTINKLADLTVEDTKYLRGAKQNAKDLVKEGTLYKPKVGVAYPDTVDWRSQGYVTPVKDQGQCGSCWAFSSTGGLEGQHFRFTGNLVSLSEQNLVDCVTGNYGCNGGWMNTAFEYIRDNGGIDTEESYTYHASDGACSYNPATVGATCTGYINIASYSEPDLLAASATEGPISVAIDASHASFQSYSSGVYYEPSCDPNYLDHAVLVVGYGNYNGADYWLVKNSWGTWWGDAGYIMMARNRDNNCGIASTASYPTV